VATIKNDPLTYQPSIRAFMRLNKLGQGDEWPQDKYIEWLLRSIGRFEHETGMVARENIVAWVRWLNNLEVA